MLRLGESCVQLTVYAVLRKSKTEKLKNIADCAFGFFLSMNSFLLPMMTTLIFSTFPCKLFDDGNRLLMRDLSIDCDTEEHESYRLYAKVMIVL